METTTEEIKRSVQEKSGSALAGQASRAATELETAAEVLRRTGENFREMQKDAYARYVEKVSGRIQDLSRYLRDKDMDRLIQDAESFVRRRPWAVIGGALMAGAMAARFLKASGRKRRMSGEFGQYGEGRLAPSTAGELPTRGSTTLHTTEEIP